MVGLLLPLEGDDGSLAGGGGVYVRMAMGEEGRPQGVGIGGIRATGVKGGEGRAPSPVPPTMAIGTGSAIYHVSRG